MDRDEADRVLGETAKLLRRMSDRDRGSGWARLAAFAAAVFLLAVGLLVVRIAVYDAALTDLVPGRS
jgi:hypothetical protein